MSPKRIKMAFTHVQQGQVVRRLDSVANPNSADEIFINCGPKQWVAVIIHWIVLFTLHTTSQKKIILSAFGTSCIFICLITFEPTCLIFLLILVCLFCCKFVVCLKFIDLLTYNFFCSILV